MNAETTVAPAALALLARLNGTPLDAVRLAALLETCGPIIEEVARLRDLDLADVHPAVIYDPSAPYRQAGR